MKKTTNPILIMAGGTGGHVYPAISVAQELLNKGHQIEWLGTSKGIESRLIPELNLTLHTLPVKGFRKKSLMLKLLAPLQLLHSIVSACRIIIDIKPKLIIGFGGYVSGPGGIASKLCAKPLIIHEQNAIAGTTNRILTLFSHVRLSAFPNALKNSIHCGNPVRKELTNLQRQPITADRPLRIMVIGGSLGAKWLNEIVPQAIIGCSSASKLEIYHQTGERWVKESVENYKAATDASEALKSLSIVAYIDDMAEAYKWADVLICRAGAMTVWEVANVGVAALFIPFPYAIDDHQTANAKWLVDNDAAMMIQEKELTATALSLIIDGWHSNRERLNRLADNAKTFAIDNSASIIANQALKIL